ncbi:MAG: beta-galactosidase trimerization domain-containing protein [Caldilineaceae bacterium]
MLTQPQNTFTDWFDRPMRWAQLTLVENDPAQYDPQFWLNYFKRIHADAACLSAGGCVAYYPTAIPFHHRSAWLGDGDPLGDLIQGCRELGMVVIVRTDPHAMRDDAYAAHPEWVAVDAEGNPRRHWARPELWVTCALGPYNFDFMTEVHREIMTRYQVEGIFSNRWSGHGICYCEHCRRNFQAAHGLALPLKRDPGDPAYRAYYQWRQDRLFALWRQWDEVIRGINPNARFIANSGGGALSTLNMKTIGELSEILFADRQARHGTMPIWANGKNGKEYRATLGNKPIGGIFSVGVEEKYRWKDSVQSEAEIRLWVADGIANDLRPWFTKFGGVLYDQRWLKPVEEIYTWHHANERYLRNERPLARVALVYSQQTAAYYGGDQARAKVEDHTLGWYQALVEARIPFEMVHDQLLDADHVDQFKTLILPNIAVLSDAQCQQLRDFVARGGSLIATFETSLYDEQGQRRSTFGLADLFGVDVTGTVEGPMQNSYLRLERDPATSDFHPLLTGITDTERIINGAQRLPVQAREPVTNPPLTLIPSYPDLPMEEVYPRTDHTGIPEVYLHEMGDSRVVYFPWDIDRTFWEVLCVDHGQLLANAVDWATNEERPVTVTGPGVLDVTVWQQAASMTVHLVNLTNAMFMKGPVRELLPVDEQVVRVQLPKGKSAQQVRLLRSDVTPVWQVVEGILQVTVPTVVDHEVVAIDF